MGFATTKRAAFNEVPGKLFFLTPSSMFELDAASMETGRAPRMFSGGHSGANRMAGLHEIDTSHFTRSDQTVSQNLLLNVNSLPENVLPASTHWHLVHALAPS